MQIVFLNTFEKTTASDGIVSAQLSICERQGEWVVMWMEGVEGQQEIWFEGISWEVMIAAFRHGIAIKMGNGYVPIIDGMLDDRLASGGSGASMLQCYGELYANEPLFQSLREWRRGKASGEKKAAYLVVTNRILWMISAFVPQTEDELRQIPGWGTAKQSAYGKEILELTAQAERATSFPLDWVAAQLDPDVFTEWLYKQKEQKFKNQMNRQHAKGKILAVMKEGGTIEQLQSMLELSRRDIMERIEGLEQEGYNMDPLISIELADMPEEEQRLIWDALQSVGDRYLKPVLQHVYGTSEAAALSMPIELLYERLRLIRLRYRRQLTDKAV